MVSKAMSCVVMSKLSRCSAAGSMPSAASVACETRAAPLSKLNSSKRSRSSSAGDAMAARDHAGVCQSVHSERDRSLITRFDRDDAQHNGKPCYRRMPGRTATPEAVPNSCCLSMRGLAHEEVM